MSDLQKEGTEGAFQNQKIKWREILVCFSLVHQANASISSHWLYGSCFSLPLWPAYDHGCGCIQLGSSLPRKNQTLLTSVDLPITFKTTTITTAATVTAAINTPLPWPAFPPFYFTPLSWQRTNAKDKSVINYLQMISYSRQLFASLMAMPNTAAQIR